MPKQSNGKRDYTKKARKLRSLGFDVKYNPAKSRYATGQHKSAVSRLWERAKYYAANEERNRLEFKRFKSKAARKDWERFVSPDQIMPGGVYIQRPKGVEKGKYKIKRKKDGSVEITTTDKRRIRDVILRIDMSAIASDPRRELERVLSRQRRPREFLLTVNGFDSDSNSFQDLESFNRYLEEELVPLLEAKSFNFKKWGKKIFGVKLVYSQKGQRKGEHEGEAFNFETGGIFDTTKRVYNRKKYLNRKKYTKPKKGKKKGT